MLLFFSNYFYSFYVNSVPCRPGESNQQPFNNKTLALSHSCPTSRMHSWIFIYFIRTFSQCDWSRSAFRNTSVERKHVGRFQRYQSAKITFPDRESDTGNPSHWPSGNPCKPVRKFWIYRTKSWSALGTSRTWSNKWSAGDCFHNCYKCLTLRNQKRLLVKLYFTDRDAKTPFSYRFLSVVRLLVVLNQSMDQRHVKGYVKSYVQLWANCRCLDACSGTNIGVY